MERGSTLSLTVMVIILAMLGLFVGYLLGNWFIQLVTGDATTTSKSTFDNRVVEEEIVVEEEEKTKKEEPPATDTEDSADQTLVQEKDASQNYATEQIKGNVFVVQVGAFGNYKNALSLQEQLKEKGFQAVITEGVPYKVQLGATTDRSEAEKTEKTVESLGYDAFITH